MCPGAVGMNHLFACDVWHILGTTANEEQMRLVAYVAVLKVDE